MSNAGNNSSSGSGNETASSSSSDPRSVHSSDARLTPGVLSPSTHSGTPGSTATASASPPLSPFAPLPPPRELPRRDPEEMYYERMQYMAHSTDSAGGSVEHNRGSGGSAGRLHSPGSSQVGSPTGSQSFLHFSTSSSEPSRSAQGGSSQVSPQIHPTAALQHTAAHREAPGARVHHSNDIVSRWIAGGSSGAAGSTGSYGAGTSSSHTAHGTVHSAARGSSTSAQYPTAPLSPARSSHSSSYDADRSQRYPSVPGSVVSYADYPTNSRQVSAVGSPALPESPLHSGGALSPLVNTGAVNPVASPGNMGPIGSGIQSLAPPSHVGQGGRAQGHGNTGQLASYGYQPFGIFPPNPAHTRTASNPGPVRVRRADSAEEAPTPRPKSSGVP
ncbi:hypothetical protein C8Q79DRAFT_509347 [Trametes meyenii]|nr:hypothetical protein C8Q79DRAFT_509347 [Trametes meyenii]